MDTFEEIGTGLQVVIVRYLEGSASEGELAELSAWLEESEEHVAQFKRYRELWTVAGGEARYRAGEAWEKVARHLSRGEARRRRMMWRRVSGWAALFAVLLSAGYYVFQGRRATEVLPMVSETIEPGCRKAVLVLSSDEQVELGEEDGDALLVEDAGVRREGDMLIYAETEPPTNQKPAYNRLITPRGGEYTVVLADGTQVWLNADSELKYPVQFLDTVRRVYLRGEAYFAVAKREYQPFVVVSEGIQVTVLGTEFNLRNYRAEEMATTLVEGAVWLTHKSGGECCLKPGQQAVVRNGGIVVKEVETSRYTCWKEGYFSFDDKTLDEILQELARWYDFTYFYRNSGLAEQVLTAKLRKFDSVDKIFDILTETRHFGFVVRGKTITVIAK